jgi:hypothetical protein
MTDNSEIQATNKVATDPAKTETLITGGEPFKSDNKPDMRLNVSHSSLENDPTKTVTSLSAPEKGLKIKVIGPFNGEAEVLPGTVLKDALRTMNTLELTFGQFKYRDEHGDPIAITRTVEKDLTLTSLRKL